MKKCKIGFTLAEVLICMTIIGVIMALSIQTLKIIQTSYAPLAYFEFNNIKQMAGELIAGNSPADNKKPSIEFNKELMQYIITTDDKFFCDSIFNMVNASGKNNCTSLASTDTDSDSGQPIIANGQEPVFIATNGHRYFISERKKDNNISEIYGYRIIGVDLNGPQKPNISAKSGTKVPDIVSFLILDNGEVYPVGVAANNIDMGEGRWVLYLNSTVKGYYYNTYEISEDGTKKHYKQFRKQETIPTECTLKTKDGTKEICNFGVVNVPKLNKENGLAVYTYREAFCTALGQKKKPTYTKYCDGLTGDLNCPPSTAGKRFDLCTVETIKPMFRYNFN